MWKYKGASSNDGVPISIRGFQGSLGEGGVAVLVCRLLVGNFRFHGHVTSGVHVQALQPLHGCISFVPA